jgi:peptidoglycan/xylan/chitin deacetylase (PgdA/CDA1 family)
MKYGLTRILPRNRWLTSGTSGLPGAPVSWTFDDGPHPEWTPELLDVLDLAGIRATFFLVGEAASRRPDLVRRIAAAGHLIGNHTYSHRTPREMTPAEFVDEFDRTQSLLADLTGEVPRFFRPPKGEMTLSMMRAVWDRGATIALWSIDPKDYRISNSDEADRWVDSYRRKSGDIVLFHDNRPWASYLMRRLIETNSALADSSVRLDEWMSGSFTRARTEQTAAQFA